KTGCRSVPARGTGTTGARDRLLAVGFRLGALRRRAARDRRARRVGTVAAASRRYFAWQSASARRRALRVGAARRAQALFAFRLARRGARICGRQSPPFRCLALGGGE